ncbi:MAG: hypothetical protein ACPHKR_11525 [bacterium]
MMSDHSRGVWLMLIGVLIVPWLDGFAKLLGQTLPFLEVAWARFSVQLIVILPLAWFRLGRNMLSLGQWRLQVLRGALLVLASTLFFASLRTMEIADAIAVFFHSSAADGGDCSHPAQGERRVKALVGGVDRVQWCIAGDSPGPGAF